VDSRPALSVTKKIALESQPEVMSLPVAYPWSVVLSGYSSFFHH